MSREAEQIRDAHRAYCEAIGTPHEEAAYLALRDIVRRTKQPATIGERLFGATVDGNGDGVKIGKLTQDERDRVVELLRCAASTHPSGHGVVGMFDAEGFVGLDAPARHDVRLWEVAWAALDACRVDGDDDDKYRYELLEAAQRVEEGSWP